MRSELVAAQLDRDGERALRTFLHEAPWGWPRPEQLAGEPLARAQEVVGLSGPRDLERGEVLLLTAQTNTTGGAVWSLRLGSPPGDVAVNAAEVWDVANRAVPGALPILWRATERRDGRTAFDPLRVLPSAVPHARRVLPRVRGRLEPHVEGPSLGLALLLAQASWLLDESLPRDVVASASVTPHGTLGHVDGLAPKVLALADAVPQVRRLLVAASDVAEARAAVEAARAELGEEMCALDVVGVATARDAVRLAFPDLEARWRARGRDARARRRLLQELVAVALADRGTVGDWRPVQRAAQLAREWPDLTETERFELAMAEATAGRHEFEAVPLSLPSRAAIQVIHEPRRTTFLAHLVQHAADTGTPEPEGVEALAGAFLARATDAFPEHLRLLGALGRLAANLGDHEVAVERQLEAAEGWLARPEHRGLSYPLSEVYRLAGVLARPDLFLRADDLLARSEQPPVLDERDRVWIKAARARGLMGLDRLEEALQHGRELWQARGVRSYVGARVLRASAAALGDEASVGAVDRDLAVDLEEKTAALALAERSSDATSADLARARGNLRLVSTCLALVALDASDGRDVGALETLERLHRELCAVLLRRVIGGARGARLRVVFPY